MKTRARRLGFTRWIRAKGAWLLSNGVIQTETVWIGCTPQPDAKARRLLPRLARLVKRACDQEAVAWERLGELRFL